MLCTGLIIIILRSHQALAYGGGVEGLLCLPSEGPAADRGGVEGLLCLPSEGPAADRGGVEGLLCLPSEGPAADGGGVEGLGAGDAERDFFTCGPLGSSAFLFPYNWTNIH